MPMISKLKILGYGILVGLIVILFGYIYFLKKDIEKLQREVTALTIQNANKQATIGSLEDVIDNQNAKIEEYSKKQQEAIKKYEEWTKKENKYKQDIQDILDTKGDSTCDTLKKRLDKIKLKGYDGL